MPLWERSKKGLLPALLPVLVCAAALLTSCLPESDRQSAAMTGGDPARGRSALSRYGCAACHEIPNYHGVQGSVGPPLAGIAERAYLGGVLGNSPENMIRWIQNPQAISPKTAMPNLSVSDADARDIAGYLYTLK